MILTTIHGANMIMVIVVYNQDMKIFGMIFALNAFANQMRQII